MCFFKKNKKDKPSKKASKIYLEFESEENSNPKIKLYNDLVRHAYNYDSEFFSTSGISDPIEIKRIFYYFLYDYPEVFWTDGYTVQGVGDTISEVRIDFRCLTPDGQIDVKDINRKRAELKKSAKYFTRGITKKTKPYDALITIYRRLILELDYDGLGLKTQKRNGDAHDLYTDDNLRSLYSALVHKKVVCAGYAVAMQYLLQSVGISCAVVSSETSDGSGHAFNALKIGKYVYYLDATWGDSSNTATGKQYAEDISYDYCCVPLKEFLLTSEEMKPYHTPDSELYPDLEEFTDINHEYYRYRKSYLVRYDENLIANAIANTAISYNPKEMGSFAVSFRCHDTRLMNYVIGQLQNGSNMYRILQKARGICKAKRSNKATKLLTDTYAIRKSNGGESGIFFISFKQA